MFIDTVHVYADGGSKGNPGPSSIGVVIFSADDRLLHEFSDCIGECTNNVAEYSAILRGLDLAAGYTRRRVSCFSDSELVIKQINGNYRITRPHLIELAVQVQGRVRLFRSVTFQHLSRNHPKIGRAHYLLNEAAQGRCADRGANRSHQVSCDAAASRSSEGLTLKR